MSTELATTSRQAIAAKTASKRNRVTGALKVACDAMVWGVDNGLALPWDEAARHAGLRVRTMRLALEKDHVRRYFKQQREVFCAQASASNISHAVKLRADSPNQMTRLGAVRFIEEVAQESLVVAGAPPQRQPGVVIVITNGPVPDPHPMIDLKADTVSTTD